LGERFLHEQRVRGQLRSVIPPHAALRILEVDGEASRAGDEQQVELAGEVERRRVKRDVEVALSFGQPILAKTPAPLERLEGRLHRLAPRHLVRPRGVDGQDVSVERDAWTVGPLLQVRDGELERLGHGYPSFSTMRRMATSFSQTGSTSSLPGSFPSVSARRANISARCVEPSWPQKALYWMRLSPKSLQTFAIRSLVRSSG